MGPMEMFNTSADLYFGLMDFFNTTADPYIGFMDFFNISADVNMGPMNMSNTTVDLHKGPVDFFNTSADLNMGPMDMFNANALLHEQANPMDIFNTTDEQTMRPVSDFQNGSNLTRDTLSNVKPPMWSKGYRSRNLITSIVGTGLNCMTLMAVLRHADLTRSLRAALVSLVSTDLGLMLSMLIGSLLFRPSDVVIYLLIYLIYVFIDCTAMTLVVIAADRAVAVFWPAWYKTHCERWPKIVPSVFSPWVLAVGFTVGSFHTADVEGLPPLPISRMTDGGVLIQSLLMLVCGLSVLISYLAMGCRLIRRSSRPDVHPVTGYRLSVPRAATSGIGKRARRITVHTIFLAGWFCIIYIPFSVYLLVVFLAGWDRAEEINSFRNIAMSTFIVINSVVNPFIFFWRLVCFRKFLAWCRKVVLGITSDPVTSDQQTQQNYHEDPQYDVELSRHGSDDLERRHTSGSRDSAVGISVIHTCQNPLSVRSVRVRTITVETSETRGKENSSSTSASHSGHVEVDVKELACSFGRTAELQRSRRHREISTISACASSVENECYLE